MKLFNNFLGMFKLENKSFKEATKVSGGEIAIMYLISSIAGALGSFWFKRDVKLLLVEIVVLFITFYIGYIISSGLIHLFARLFGGKGGIKGFFRAYSHFSLISIIAIIPFIGSLLSALLGLWAIVMGVFLIKEHYTLSTGKAIAVILLPLIILVILAFVTIGFIAFSSLISPSALMPIN